MKVIVGVSNFGKIKKAEIDISNFTIFVGNNNSGKTYMMQLIYGVLAELSEFKPKMETLEIGHGIKYELKEEIGELEKQVNHFLKKNKDRIVQRIFHKPVSIQQLYVKLVMEDEIFCIRFSAEDNLVEEQQRESATLVNEQGLEVCIALEGMTSKKKISHHKIQFLRTPTPKVAWDFIYRRMINIIFSKGNNLRNDSIFIPASRTGMLLLYKYFFAERSANDIRNIADMSLESEKNENELGLSSPVYDFLQFLLRYTPSQLNFDRNKDIIDFIQQNLLDGRLQQAGEDTVYIPQGTDIQIPLYLSSSMINEITPLYKVLTSTSRCRTIFYDEIETCLHPLKQGEMARTLIRMNNNGYRLIVSTHSDTMAAKINNLLLLSKVEESEQDKNGKLEKMKLTKDDILKSDEFHVYQFINSEDGKSEVSELEFHTTPPTGYDFSLFMDSVNELYNETGIVME